MKNKIKVVAFDADDTLWDNEPYFREAEERFCALLSDYLPAHTLSRELLEVEKQNIDYYGYGVKSFVLSMIETAVKVTEGRIDGPAVEKIIAIGKHMIDQPVNVLEGVEEVLLALRDRYKLVVATKGDLLDQERKLFRSGLEHYFHHIEIMTEKNEVEYRKLIRHLDIENESFMMIGNSLKSDVLPVLGLGGYGCHVHYHTTWALEKIDIRIENERFHPLQDIREVLPFLI